MWFSNLFDSLRSGRSRPPAQKPPRGALRRQPCAGRLELETLEDRLVPASLSVSDVVLLEGNSGTQNAMVTVSLSAPSHRTVSVHYKTANGSARAGSDYQAVSGKLTFAPGQTSKSILVPVRGDRLSEADETFFVKLRDASNARIADAWGAVTIMDNEPRLSISDAAVTEGNAGSTLATFTVSLATAYDRAVTVSYATQDGTAIAGEDYLAAAGTLTFAPGETTKSFTIEVYGDTTPEPAETFYVNLSGASTNALISRGQGYATVMDDDGWVDTSWIDYGLYDTGYYDYGYNPYGYYDSYGYY